MSFQYGKRTLINQLYKPILLQLNNIKLSNYRTNYVSNTRKVIRPPRDQLETFSKLYVSEKYKSVTYKVVEPELKLESLLDDEYVNKLRKVIKLRKIDELNDINFEELRKDAKELFEIKEKIKELLKLEDWDLIHKVNVRLFELEEKIVPTILKLPNLFDEKEVSLDNEDKILKQIKPKSFNFKLLDCKKISYINNLRKSSIIGPHCEYLLGNGSLIYLALNKYFKNLIKDTFPEPNTNKVYRHLHEVDGLDFVKSALIEAANDFKQHDHIIDKLELDLNEKSNTKNNQQHLHLVGNSKEGLLGLLIKKRIDKEYLPARFVQFGPKYDQSFKQQNTICMFTIIENDFKVSNNEFKLMEEFIWSSYKKLNLPIRLRRLCLNNLNLNEYNSVELDVYLPYSREWKKIANFTHYSDYLTTRVHDTTHHCLSGYLTDFNLLLDAILENYQTETGKLIIPDAIQKYMYNCN